MRILALDTATGAPSIALDADDGLPVRVVRLAVGRDDGLVPALGATLAASGLGFADLDRLAVAVGPGRFTGLRAGLAAMRGLALATGLPLVGVTTLEAIAAAARAGAAETVVAVVDSLRAEAFVQAFRAGAALGPAFACRPDALAERLAETGSLVLAGERLDEVAAALAAAGRAVRMAPGFDAGAVAALASGRAPEDAPPAPFYLHPPATTKPRARVVAR